MSLPNGGTPAYASRVLVSLFITGIIMAGATIAWWSKASSSALPSKDPTLEQYSERIDHLNSRSRLILAHLFAIHSSNEGMAPRSVELCVNQLFQGDSEEWEVCSPMERKKMQPSVALFGQILDYVETFHPSGEPQNQSRMPAQESNFVEPNPHEFPHPVRPNLDSEEMPKGPRNGAPLWNPYQDGTSTEV